MILSQLKGKRQLLELHVDDELEAAAAEQAGIDMFTWEVDSKLEKIRAARLRDLPGLHETAVRGRKLRGRAHHGHAASRRICATPAKLKAFRPRRADHHHLADGACQLISKRTNVYLVSPLN